MNWLQTTQEHLAAATLSCPGCSRALALRLSHLLFQRLGNPLASTLSGLLPQGEQSLFAGMLLELGPGDPSIGYPQFLEHAASLFPDAGTPEVVDSFLQGVHAGLPDSFSSVISAALPLELRQPFNQVPTQLLRAA